MKKKILKRIGFGFAILLLIMFVGAKIKRVSPLSWGHAEINTQMFGSEAINGYDPVAYFTLGKAVIGERSITYMWKEASWYFSTQENMELFKTNPEKYTPQLGGYCAFAASKGFTANTDPEAFKIIDGKLYLCADKEMLKNWLEGGQESRKMSEGNWN